MRTAFILMCILVLSTIVGCGGGGGSPSNGNIGGFVKDTSNNPVPGATISTNIGGYSVTSGLDGGYVIPNVAPGTYSVSAVRNGYISHQATNVLVVANQSAAQDFELSHTTAPIILATSSDEKVVLVGPSDAVPGNITPTVQSKQATDFTPALTGPAFVAAAAVTPAGQALDKPVQIVFHLSVPLAAGKEARLYLLDASGKGSYTDIKAVLSVNRSTATVTITSFDSNSYYVLLTA